jgi:hypothetical protein
MPKLRAKPDTLKRTKVSEATQVVLAKIKDQRRPGYIRTSERFRYPQRPARMPQRRGESDKDYVARIDAAREEAYERARRRLRRT